MSGAVGSSAGGGSDGGRVSCLLFDLDGTLADTRDDLRDALNHALARFHLPSRTREEVTAFIGDGVRLLLLRALGPGRENLLEEALAIFRPYYEEHCADRTRLFPGVRETLEKLTGVKLGVVTNKPDIATKRVLSGLKIDQFFPVVVGGGTLPRLKPHPDPLLEAARRLGVSPAGTWMVGDSGVDVAAGKAAGMATCGVCFGYRPESELRSAGADFLAYRFEDVLRLPDFQ